MTDGDPGQKPQAKVEPETLELRARPQPVTRINRKVLIGGAAVVLLLISGIVLVALKPPNLRVASPQELFNVDHKPISDGLNKLPSTYDGVRTDRKVDASKLPPGVPQLAESSTDPVAEAERIEKARLARMAGQAREAQVFFRLQLKVPPHEAPRAEARPDPVPRPRPISADGDLATLSAWRAGDRARALVIGTFSAVKDGYAGTIRTLTLTAILFAAPEASLGKSATAPAVRYSKIYSNAQFWRLAPLSALGVGTSWSLQGLWAAPWLRDVVGLERAEIVHHLGLMAIAVCVAALLLGTAADKLRHAGVPTETLLAVTLSLSAIAQAALVWGWPLPPLLPFTIIAAAGAATVLSFASVGRYFPRSMTGRANGALNLLHVGCAFAVQWATGLLIAQWPESQGSYPAEAHRSAMAVLLVLQLAALMWFVSAHRAVRFWSMTMPPALATRRGVQPTRRPRLALAPADGWRTAAVASTSVCLALAALLIATVAQTGKPDAASLPPWSSMAAAGAMPHLYVQVSP